MPQGWQCPLIVMGDNRMCSRCKKWMRLNWSLNVSSLSIQSQCWEKTCLVSHHSQYDCSLGQHKQLKSLDFFRLRLVFSDNESKVRMAPDGENWDQFCWLNLSDNCSGLRVSLNPEYFWVMNSRQRKWPFPPRPVTHEAPTGTDKPLCTLLTHFPGWRCERSK